MIDHCRTSTFWPGQGNVFSLLVPGQVDFCNISTALRYRNSRPGSVYIDVIQIEHSMMRMKTKDYADSKLLFAFVYFSLNCVF